MERKYDASANHRRSKGATRSESHLHPRVNPSDKEEGSPRPAEHWKILVIVEAQDGRAGNLRVARQRGRQ